MNTNRFEPAVRSLALNEEAADALLGTMRSAMHGPTSGIVPGALATLGMRVPKDVLAEVRRRSVPVHEFVMARDDEDPIRESLPRLRMVRALLAAVAVKSIGYEGPVLGWQQDAEGHRDELTWWDPLDDPEVARFGPAFINGKRTILELRGHGVEIISVADGFDLNGPAAEVVLAVLSWASKMERLAVGERVAAARERIEAEGGAWGRPSRVDRATRERAAVLKAAGKTVREIARDLKVPRSTIARALSQKGGAREGADRPGYPGVQ